MSFLTGKSTPHGLITEFGNMDGKSLFAIGGDYRGGRTPEPSRCARTSTLPRLALQKDLAAVRSLTELTAAAASALPRG